MMIVAKLVRIFGQTGNGNLNALSIGANGHQITGDLTATGRLNVSGSVSSNVRATNVLCSASASQPDTALQDTLTSFQKTLDRSQGSFVQLPSPY